MCGIVGLWKARAEPVGQQVEAMARTIAHRGPDSSGIWVDERAGLGLGHRRLAIVDLSHHGQQPMISADHRLVLSFNGEIYNHGEMRERLLQSTGGRPLRGTSDTETLLEYIAAFGLERALADSVGMFAFALWDVENRCLHLARDRMGEKPLYFGWIRGSFAFASELKALSVLDGFDAAIDRQALAHFMRYSTIPAPRSIYRGIAKLLPGHLLTLSPQHLADQSLPEQTCYWSLRTAAEDARRKATPSSDSEAIDLVDRQLRRATADQLMADVPLGAFLSGGVDSSLIVALMQAQSDRPIRTFTIGFDDKRYDEALVAQSVARHLGTDHTELYVSEADVRSRVPLLAQTFCEPFADVSQLPTMLVCDLASRHVKVALSGDGGDELFGGYNRYIGGISMWQRIEHLPAPARRLAGRGLAAMDPAVYGYIYDLVEPLIPASRRVRLVGNKVHKISRMLTAADGDFHQAAVSVFPEAVKLGPVDDERAWVVDAAGDYVERMMLADATGYLPDDVLVKVDRAAMAHSLETRAPFLDHRVVELAFSLPQEMKIRAGEGKWVLKQLLRRYLPDELIDRPKMGFAVPIAEWLRGPLRDWAEDLLRRDALEATGHLDADLIRQRWDQHLNGRFDWQYELWNVLMFQSWWQRWAVRA
jgi:asparagine synthase (glutamine-hydrolysing)